MESVLWGLRRRTWLFGVSLFLTLAPLSFDFTHGLSRMVRGVPWHASFDWSLAAVLWFVYFAHLRWRTANLVCAILFTLIPIPFVLHSVLAGGPVLEFAMVWIWAAFVWLGYFRGGLVRTGKTPYWGVTVVIRQLRKLAPFRRGLSVMAILQQLISRPLALIR